MSLHILPCLIGNGTATTFIAAFSDSDAGVARFFTPDESEASVERFLLSDRDLGGEKPDEMAGCVIVN